ncbi:DNA pilot protein [Microviridae sp.]|nr:DNA pilot protein [Microviridae sp.]
MGFLSSVTKGLKSVTGAIGDVFEPISGLVSAGANFFGQERANSANSALAQRQMDFQQDLSNTAWQRGMADMRKAGMNPIFAYKTGAASTPGGSLATMANSSASAVDAFNATTNTALASKMNSKTLNRMDEEIKNLRETNLNLKEQNKLIKNQTWREGTQAAVNEQTALKILEEKFLTQNYLQMSSAQLKAALTKGKFRSESPNLIKFEAILEALGRLLGGGNSAAVIKGISK